MHFYSVSSSFWGRRRLSCAALLAFVGAMAADATPRDETAASTSALLWQQVLAEVADAACDAPQQCHTIAVGNKACGGPEAYLAWSSKQTSAARLEPLVSQHAAERRAENARSGSVSDCSMVMDPGATCQVKRCTLLPYAGFAIDADKVFAWAEKSFPHIFEPLGQGSVSAWGYRYRSYAAGHYLAVRESGSANLHYLGPLSNHTLLDLGPLSDWVIQAGP